MASTPQTLWELSLKIVGSIAAIGFLILLVILVSLVISQNASLPKVRRKGTPVHLLVVLGSGGHTAEMLAILENNFDYSIYTYRTYVVSSGDDLSAQKAVKFEDTIAQQKDSKAPTENYAIVTIPRARRDDTPTSVHSLRSTLPVTPILSSPTAQL
ncbi:UDP-N-acetylglucosamine transferase subunit [Penicillium ochrochloron]